MLTCNACSAFTTSASEVMILHQAICSQMDEEKREYRLALGQLLFGANLDEALAVVREMG